MCTFRSPGFFGLALSGLHIAVKEGLVNELAYRLPSVSLGRVLRNLSFLRYVVALPVVAQHDVVSLDSFRIEVEMRLEMHHVRRQVEAETLQLCDFIGTVQPVPVGR